MILAWASPFKFITILCMNFKLTCQNMRENSYDEMNPVENNSFIWIRSTAKQRYDRLEK